MKKKKPLGDFYAFPDGFLKQERYFCRLIMM